MKNKILTKMFLTMPFSYMFSIVLKNTYSKDTIYIYRKDKKEKLNPFKDLPYRPLLVRIVANKNGWVKYKYISNSVYKYGSMSVYRFITVFSKYGK